MRHGFFALVVALGVAGPLHGQSLRSQLLDLFRFGDCGNEALLCLRNTSGQDAALTFSDAVEDGNRLLIEFMTRAVGLGVANIPTPATSSGSVVEFTPGGRIQTRRLSAGPIYAERAPTLGRTNLLFGVLLARMRFSQLRGVPTENLVFNFKHVDIPGTPGFGNPVQENNVLQVQMELEFQTLVSSFFVTYGITNNLDVGVAVPLVRTSFAGRSVAQIVPFGENSVYTFGGPAADPRLTETSVQDGSAIGIGDIGIRAKWNLKESGRVGVAFLGDLRLPTGAEDDLLGLGSFAARAVGVTSAAYGNFTPHINLGYQYRALGDSLPNHSLLAILGFDQMFTAGITLAVDILSEFQLDEGTLRVPPPIEFTEPFTRTVAATTIPDRRDHRIDATIGFKWAVPCTEGWNTFCATGSRAGKGLTIITAAVAPLNSGGFRGGIVWSLGAQYKF